MSRSNRNRRLSVAPLAGVERRGRGALGGGGLVVGIPDSLPLGSHFIQGSHPFASVCSQVHQGQSSGGGGSGSPEQGCHRVGSASISRLLQPAVCCYESFRCVEAGHRPVHSELEGTADILQDGDAPIRSSLGSSGGLDGVSGLEGCVLAGANAPGFSQVPQIHGGGEGVPVQGTLFRPLHGSTSFYQGHGSCVSDSRIRKNLFIHIARIPIGDSPRVHPNILKCSLHSPVAKGIRLVVFATRAMVCDTPTHYLILNSLASARGRVILRLHFLILLLLIILISLYSHLFLTSTVILLLCDRCVRIFQQCFVDADR